MSAGTSELQHGSSANKYEEEVVELLVDLSLKTGSNLDG